MQVSLTTSQGYIFIVSFLLTVGLFYIILFFAFKRKTSYIFFCLLCFFHVIKLVIRPDQDFIHVSPSIAQHIEKWHSFPFMLGSVCLIGFLLFEFNIERRLTVLSGFLAVLLSFYLFRLPPFGLIILTGLVVSVMALKKDRVGGGYAIIALLLFALFTRLEFAQKLGVAYYLGVVIFIIIMTILVGQRIKVTLRQQKEAHIKSVQLENQLLKTTIQPHFITNSLTSLQELIETDPKEANHFIQNLAEEFRLFSLVADQKLISIEKEILLCQTHLEIMSKRKQGKYKLNITDISGKEQVPPGIFHTIIENGLTHGFRKKSAGTFELNKCMRNGNVVYQLSNNGDFDENAQTGCGTGFKYIHNRLRENYGEDWSFESGYREGLYHVLITVPA